MRLHGGAVLGKDVVKRRGRGGAELFLCGEGMARGRRCIVREEDDAADRWGRSASERECTRERLAGGAGLPEREKEGSAREASRAGVGRLLGRKEDARARGSGGEAAAAWARFGLAGGRRAFSFFFLFSITHFHFYPFF
jgi:hypothetical protein